MFSRYITNNVVAPFCRLQSSRSASIFAALEANPVLISSNKDIYTNLALEHYLFSNIDFGNGTEDKTAVSKKIFEKPIALIWVDEPCLVIGRHQNPWLESKLGLINNAGLKVARRYSGGGCVYHDENNINISIIGNRKNFEKRNENMKFLGDILKSKYGLDFEATKRHDLIERNSGLKISGSAAKLGRVNSYHHFTLLVDTDKEALYTAIRQEQQSFIQTNSSQSTRSNVINLKELKADLNVDQVVSDLAGEYYKLFKASNSKQTQSRTERAEVDDTDSHIVSKYREELQSWKWIYGMTPKFTLEKIFTVTEKGLEKQVKFKIVVDRGLFHSIEIESELESHNPIDKFQYLVGTKFTYKDSMINATKLLDVDDSIPFSTSMATEQIFVAFLLQLIQESNF